MALLVQFKSDPSSLTNDGVPVLACCLNVCTSVNHRGGGALASALRDSHGHLSVSSAPLYIFPLDPGIHSLVPDT